MRAQPKFNPLAAAIALYFVIALIAILLYFGDKIYNFLIP